MASLLIRKLDPALHARIKQLATRHASSVEEEARELLRHAVAYAVAAPAEPPGSLARRVFAPLGGVELDLPPRDAGPNRPLPDFCTPTQTTGAAT